MILLTLTPEEGQDLYSAIEEAKEFAQKFNLKKVKLVFS